MKPILSLASAGKLDPYLILKYSLSESDLISSAASGAYSIVRDKLLSKKVLFVIGKGNNGADGLEMAYLASKENKNVSVMLLSEEGSAENIKRRKLTQDIDRTSSLEGYDVIVDAIFGFGFKGELSGVYKEVVDNINESGAYIISLDVPSAFKVVADETVSFTTLKLDFFEPMHRRFAGSVHLFNPGFPIDEIEASPDDIYLFTDSDISLEPFGITEYKNTRGHVAVIGGSSRYPGAPVLSIRAAIKSGAGMATLVSSSDVLELAYAHYPSIIRQKENTFDPSRYDSFVIGPGWDEGDGTLLDQVIESGKRFVVDADGIKHLKGRRLGWNGVITPHIGEWKRLCASLSISSGIGNSEELCSSLRFVAKTLQCVVVLKSSTIWICSSDKIMIYDGVNPSVAVAGSGDVLSGIIGALLCSGEDVFSSALNGVIIHQGAGRRAHDEKGYYMAEDLVEAIRGI